jgi:type IV pilus assembly protein PilP
MLVTLMAALLLQAAAAPAQPAPAKPFPVQPAQAPPEAAQPAGPSSSAGQTQPPLQTDTYSYQPGGRRDPFVSLLSSGPDPRQPSRRGEGAAGLTVGEISVRGVMQSRNGMIAMIQGPDNKTYLVRQGDRLVDGTIKAITSQGIVVDQQINDPLSTIKQREVVKPLRPLEGAKESQ